MPEHNWEFLDKYCSDCHNSTDWAGGVAFDTLDAEDVAPDAKIWEEAVRKLRGSLMPPPGEPQPDAASKKAFIASMETTLDKSAADRRQSRHGGAAPAEPPRVRESPSASCWTSRSMPRRCCRATIPARASTTWPKC